jgi:hypothetical protein
VVVDWEGSPRVESRVAVELVVVLLQPQLLLVPQLPLFRRLLLLLLLPNVEAVVSSAGG